MVGLQHFDQQTHDAGRCVEFAALLPFRPGEFAEEVFVDLSEHIPAAVLCGVELQAGDDAHQFPKLSLCQREPRKLSVQDTFERRVLGLDLAQAQEVEEVLPKITQAKVAADGKSVRLTISPLTKGHIHELHLDGVRSAQKLPLLHTVGYYTLNEIPH